MSLMKMILSMKKQKMKGRGGQQFLHELGRRVQIMLTTCSSLLQEHVCRQCMRTTHRYASRIEPSSERETEVGQVSKWGVERVLLFFEDC